MDSEPELVKLGYSSSLRDLRLSVWMIKNNFPKGFQVLCHNCNLAKGFYGKCPHEKSWSNLSETNRSCRVNGSDWRRTQGEKKRV